MTARQSTEFELDALTSTRLHLAGQIAAGLAANQTVTVCNNWEAFAARSALDVADKIIRLTVSGGI